MKAATYYVLAGALVLATVPMYRYIFWRSAQLSAHQRVPQTLVVTALPAPLAPLDRSRSHPVRLLKGELCEGGVVVSVQGSTYTELLTGSCRPARCEGRNLLS